MNPQTVSKCYPCGKVETDTEFLMSFEDHKICFKCMIIIAGMTFDEDLCLSICDGTGIKNLRPMALKRLKKIQDKSDCYINPATLILREKCHTYFALMHRPFERN